MALLGKWRWRLVVEKEALWNRVVEAKYGIHRRRDWEGREVKMNSSYWWKALWKLDKERGSDEGWMYKGVVKTVGEGNDTLFWHEKWCGDAPFRVKFNRLFRLAEDKDALVKNMGEWRNGEWIWKWSWSRELLGRENTLVQDLNKLLQGSKLEQGQQDSWRWKYESKGTYSTKSAYTLLKSSNREADTRRFSMLWNNKVPLKVSAFVWKGMQNRIPTGDNLVKRGIVGSNTDFACIFCGKQTETASHLFFTCDATWAIWHAAYAWWGLQAVLTCEGWKHLQQHMGMVRNKKVKESWYVIWFTIIWSIWLWRNQLIFKEGNDTPAMVLDLIKMRSLYWIRAKQNTELAKELWLVNPREACK
ncbi:hypothetical protein SLEP1_g44662 [Rubroshorea leprosula]|uniref:Reverse transcriptase zinc-binding domain-containing protein n=1 Tax=Rubroshorea leprosula TaxID=152421 RepID=A0AAV5LGZ7_9ROSI|nr:hypothetical protein SLEP1_g44662 [Rubroshorea leprosula]